MWGGRMGYTYRVSVEQILRSVPCPTCSDFLSWGGDGWATDYMQEWYISENIGHTDTGCHEEATEHLSCRDLSKPVVLCWDNPMCVCRDQNGQSASEMQGISTVREAFLVLFALELHKCLVPQVSKVIYYQWAALKDADSCCFVISGNNLACGFLEYSSMF